ncbi:MAG: CvpA family protein [Moraxella sp.]|nr:CvpA family protein [Moraxella sp.]
MTAIDGIILFILAIGLLRGFMAGAVRTIFSLAGWLLALVLASKFAPIFALFLQPLIENRVWQITMAFLCVVLVIVGLMHLVSWFILKTLKLLKLGLLDKILGAILGVVKNTVKVLILLSITSPILPHLPNAGSSVLMQSLLPFAPVTKEVIGQALKDIWQEMENPYQSV